MSEKQKPKPPWKQSIEAAHPGGKPIDPPRALVGYALSLPQTTAALTLALCSVVWPARHLDIDSAHADAATLRRALSADTGATLLKRTQKHLADAERIVTALRRIESHLIRHTSGLPPKSAKRAKR